MKKEIYRMVAEGDKKFPARDLMKSVSRRFGVDVPTVRKVIQGMVGDGTLVYTNLYGTSFLEASLERPVRVSERIVIKPPHKRFESQPEDVVIDLDKGTAFGEGRHPTTCLVLEAIDSALRLFDGETEPQRPLTGLDVGTGTGILAIALAKLGVEKVLGTDLDPCAISEARHNVSLNGLDDQVTVLDRPLEVLDGGYLVVLANLALPTLKSMAPTLVELTASGGVIILSGFRATALLSVRKIFEPLGIHLDRETTDRGWACTTWRKP